MNRKPHWEPRKKSSGEIKLLRLDLQARGESPCEGIGTEWNPEQPAENLSPEKAAQYLSIDEWTPPTLVRKRFRTLQLRYPPEQFTGRHLDWRPSAELLTSPSLHLNWYWRSGLIPTFWSNLEPTDDALWDSSSVEPTINSLIVLERIKEI